jgi:hypothetical protein
MSKGKVVFEDLKVQLFFRVVLANAMREAPSFQSRRAMETKIKDATLHIIVNSLATERAK